MIIDKLSNFKRGWFIGNFCETLLKTKKFEVAVKRYKAGDCEYKHLHKIGTEYSVVIKGVVKMNEKMYRQGTIIIMEPGEATNFKAVTDAVNIVIKVPSVKGDKYKVDTSDPLAFKNRFKGHYIEWRVKRIRAIVDYYGKKFFKGKTLLELGCGYGEIGNYFYKLGCKVTCLDGREEHLKVVRQKYPYLQTLCMDLEKEFPSETYDIIIHMGTLYHLKKYMLSFKASCANSKHLILETEVLDSKDPEDVVFIRDTHTQYDQSLHGYAARLSVGHIEKILLDHKMSIYRITDNRCNTFLHTYDWKESGTKKSILGQRAMWFCDKKL